MMKFFQYPFLLLSAFLITQLPAIARDKKEATTSVNIPLVSLSSGQLQGTTEEGVCVWRGIPYAQSPTGAYRFKSPEPVKPWNGVRDASLYGYASLQPQSSFLRGDSTSEDCLYLNVWSPAADGKKRPVMVWIHGGGFIVGAGSSDLYNGANMARNGDVVVVTLNYRLGVLGFLYFNDKQQKAGFENNLGIRDQIAALQWVKNNISAFGGDPDNVTIFGESAGGTSVETLLACPGAKGLFHAAIAQSGPSSLLWQASTGESLTSKFLSFLKISPDSIHLLSNLSADTLKWAESRLIEYMTKETTTRVFSPTIDGNLLTTDIASCLSPKQSGNVALMIGTTKDEATMFTKKGLEMVPDNAEDLDKDFLHVLKPEEKTRVISAYSRYPRKRGVLDLLTDAVFRVPAIRLAECQAMHSPVYMYRFEWSSFLLNLSGMRSFHGLELPFVFANGNRKSTKLLKVLATRKTVNRLSNEMQQAWVNFARYRNPNGKDGGIWKMYSKDERSTMIFDRKSRVVNDPDSVQRAAWEGVQYF